MKTYVKFKYEVLVYSRPGTNAWESSLYKRDGSRVPLYLFDETVEEDTSFFHKTHVKKWRAFRESLWAKIYLQNVPQNWGYSKYSQF